MLASKTIVNKPVLVDSNPAIDTGHQIFLTILAKSFLKSGRKLYLVFHGNSPGKLDILIRLFAVFLEMLLGKLE